MSNTKEKTPITLGYQTLSLICFGILITYFLIENMLLGNFKFSVNNAFYDAIVSSFIVSLVCYGITNSLKFYIPKKKQIWKILGIGFMASAITILITRFIILYYFDSSYLKSFDYSIPFRFIINYLILNTVAIIIIIWNIQEDNIANFNRKQESEKLLRDAELYNLRQQLQPHFLFNSLNSIVALIDQNPEKAKEMTFQLSDFLRSTLRKDNDQLISLEHELEHLQLYLDIEKVRFGHRLSTQIDCEESLLNSRIPAMILQPLVENAIKYGLYDMTKEVNISINCKLKNRILEITISNPFDAQQHQTKKGSGFGLSSIQRRMFLIYGIYDLLTTRVANNQFYSTLNIPQL